MSTPVIILIGAPSGLVERINHMLRNEPPMQVIVIDGQPDTLPPVVTPNPEPDPVEVIRELALDYEIGCDFGQVLFKVSGGDGSLIEVMGPGVTAWTPYKEGVRYTIDIPVWNDRKPLKLYARQSGKTIEKEARIDHCFPAPINQSPKPEPTKPVPQPIPDKPLPAPATPEPTTPVATSEGTITEMGNLD